MSELAQFGFNFDAPAAPPILEEIPSELGKVKEESSDSVGVQSRVEVERNGQIQLLNIGEWWEEYWKGMPEFVQEDQAPWKTVYVHFESREDMDKFSALVGQKIGLNTRSIWYPEAEIGHFAGKRYADSEPEEEIEGVETFEDEE